MKKLSKEEKLELDWEIESNCPFEQGLVLNGNDNKYNFTMWDVCGYLLENPEITSLNISHIDLDDRDVSALVPVLSNIKQLTLNHLKISDEGMRYLLGQNPAITLAFNYCRITYQ